MNTYRKLLFVSLSALTPLALTIHTMAPPIVAPADASADQPPTYPLSDKFQTYKLMIKEKAPKGQQIRNLAQNLGDIGKQLKLETDSKKRALLKKNFAQALHHLQNTTEAYAGVKTMLVTMEQVFTLLPTADQNEAIDAQIGVLTKTKENDKKTATEFEKLALQWNEKNGKPDQAEHRGKLLGKTREAKLRCDLQNKDFEAMASNFFMTRFMLQIPKIKEELAKDETSEKQGLALLNNPQMERMLRQFAGRTE